MAINVTTSAINNITEYPNSFKRQGAFPLERYSLFNTLADAQDYATNNPIAYVGQPVVVATTDNPPKVTSFIIGANGSLIEQATAEALSSSASDLQEAINTAIEGLDSSVSATAANGNKYSVLTGVTETDGKLTSKTEVQLEAVAKTGAAADVSIADSTNVITATTVEGALTEIATEIDGMDLASTPIATVANNVVTIKAIKEVDGKVSVDNTAANLVTLKEVAYTGKAEDVSFDGTNTELLTTATTVQDALETLDSELNDLVSDSAVTMNVTDGAANSGILKTYTIAQGGIEIGSINIPRDFLVNSGSLKTVTTANSPYTGAAVGDKYIELVLNVKSGTETDSKIYIPCNDLFDSYTSGSDNTDDVVITVNNSTNKISATVTDIDASKINHENDNGDTTVEQALDRLEGSDTTTGSVAKALKDAKAYTDSSIDALAGTATSAALAAGSATATSSSDVVKAVATVTVTTADGEVSTVTATGVDVDKAGAAAKAKTEVIGGENDAATADTIWGAKNYTDREIAALDTTSDVTVASLGTGANANKVTLLGSIKEVDGVIDTGSATSITLADVAKTGTAADVAIVDSGNKITATNVESALAEIATEIDGMDLASTAIATVNNNVVTIKAIKEVDGKVSVDGTDNTLVLEEVAYTGAASDVSVAADNVSGLTAGTVQETLQDLKTAISDNDIDIQTGSTDGTIKWKKGSDAGYTEVTPKNLKTVATTGSAADVSIADADNVITATTVEGALAEIAKEINAMDKVADATKTAVGGSSTRAKTNSHSTQVLQSLTETDGVFSAMAVVEVEPAGDATVDGAKTFTKIATLNGGATVPTGKKITLTDAPSDNTDAANKSYVDTSISNAIEGLDTDSNVTVASVSNNVVTLTKAVKEENGIISAVTGSGSTIALEEVAYTGAASDVAVAADATSGLSSGTVQGTLQTLTGILKAIASLSYITDPNADVTAAFNKINAIIHAAGKATAPTVME